VEEQLGIGVTQVSKDGVPVEFGTEWVLVAGVPGCVTSMGDLCICDFTSGQAAIPQDLEPAKPCKHWFVVHRKDLLALQTLVGTNDLKVLLNPVTRRTLKALLGGVNAHSGEPKDDSVGLVDTLRFERDQMLQFLIQANLKMQESDQERSNFLARSIRDSHAPLTAISGYCGLLLEEEFGPLTPEQRRVLELMRHSATRLSRISSGMFELSVPHDADQTVNLEKADIRDCLDQALHEVALVLEDKRISVVAEIEPAPENLLFEKSLIEQAFANVLDNACKFTPRDGMIQIKGYPFFWERRAGRDASLHRAPERRIRQVKVLNSFRIDIRDSGPGIPAVHADRIFEEYTSYGGKQDRSGGGLGLAICRMIVRRHQGHIWAESSPSGAVFSLVLPLQQTDARPSEAEDSSN
jgi:signal transduction histidine kinase